MHNLMGVPSSRNQNFRAIHHINDFMHLGHFLSGFGLNPAILYAHTLLCIRE